MTTTEPVMPGPTSLRRPLTDLSARPQLDGGSAQEVLRTPAREAAAGHSAGVHVVVDLRLRRPDDRRARLSSCSPGWCSSFEGPAWYHTSSVGLFVNSLHFWSVQLFFVFMVVHLWGKFWMAAWRGRRAMTWITGAVAFLASIATAFTGYLMQTNFDSQWISFEAKDGLNAVGIGAWFNVANLGQTLLAPRVPAPAGTRRDHRRSRAAGAEARHRPPDRRARADSRTASAEDRGGVSDGQQHSQRR